MNSKLIFFFFWFFSKSCYILLLHLCWEKKDFSFLWHLFTVDDYCNFSWYYVWAFGSNYVFTIQYVACWMLILRKILTMYSICTESKQQRKKKHEEEWNWKQFICQINILDVCSNSRKKNDFEVNRITIQSWINNRST